MALIISASGACRAEVLWSGAYAGGFVPFSRNVVGGATLKSDGTVGSNATRESANIRNDATGLGMWLGTRRQLAAGGVVGLEGDLAWLGHRDRYVNRIEGGTYDRQPSATLQYDTRWLATARAVAGWPVGPVLLYGTAGLAMASEKVSRTQYKGNGSTGLTEAMFTETDSATRLGYAVGAGAEWRFNSRWSLRGEYLHTHFPEATFRFPDARGGAQGSYSNVQGRIADNGAFMNSVRIGLSFAF